MAQGNDAAAGSRRGRSFERLEELCLKAAGTPPATFLGRVLWLCWAAGVEPARKNRAGLLVREAPATTGRRQCEPSIEDKEVSPAGLFYANCTPSSGHC